MYLGLGCGRINYNTPYTGSVRLAYTCGVPAASEEFVRFFAVTMACNRLVDWSSYDRRRMRTTSIYGPTTSSSNTA